MASAEYDSIGVGYAGARRPDPRIATIVHAPLAGARTVLNVGAGTGNYEPADRSVTAVEPSAAMIRQRPAGDAAVVRAVAGGLPFADDSFDAAMATLTVHHWVDVRQGLAEMRRVARDTIVVLTFDPCATTFWLVDYLPELAALDEAMMPDLALFGEVFGPVQQLAVPIPHDCTDGMLCAFWRRPAAYLDPLVRRSMSSFSKIGDVTHGLGRLADDLTSGEWERRYGALLDLDACDLGYRLIVAP